MRKTAIILLLVIVPPLTIHGCKPGQSLTATPQLPPQTTISPTTTRASLTPTPQRETILVTSLADRGPGTLRQALLDAQPGDVITFDPAIFLTEGTSQHLMLQYGNYSPITVIRNKPSSELDNNRIGDVAETEHIDPRIWNGGTKWMRVIIDSYGKWQHVDWERGEYDIDTKDEKAIDDLVCF
jgi:hypothetical protein